MGASPGEPDGKAGACWRVSQTASRDERADSRKNAEPWRDIGIVAKMRWNVAKSSTVPKLLRAEAFAHFVEGGAGGIGAGAETRQDQNEARRAFGLGVAC